MFDLIRLAYVAKSRREARGMNMRALERISGVSKTQISRIENNQTVNAGNTFMLMVALDIAPEEMLTREALERFQKLKKAHREEAEDAEAEKVSREKSGETRRCAMPMMSEVR